MQVIQDERASVVQSRGRNITILLSRRRLSEEMLAEGVRKIAGVADPDFELDFGQLEHDITRKLIFSPDVNVCDQVCGKAESPRVSLSS